MLTSTYTDFVKKFMILRLIFGYCIDFGNSKYILVTVCSCYCFILLLTTFSSFVFVFARNIKLNNTDSYNLLEFLVNCTAALIFKSKYVKKSITLLCTSGELLQTKTISIPWKISLYLFFTFCFRIYNFFVYTMLTILSLPYFISFTVVISSYLNYNSKLLVLNIIHKQIRHLRGKFDTKYLMLNIIGKDRRDYKISNIKKCLVVYNLLITSVEEMDYELETWLLTLVLSQFPKCVIFMYFGTLQSIKEGILGLHIRYLGLFIVTLTFVAIPMIIFELIKKEVDIIKGNLFRQLLNCTDEALEQEIQSALDYLNSRPFEHKIFRMLSMGIALPLTFLSLCITYVIVMAQFT